MEVVVSTYTNKTQNEFLNGGKLYLGSRNRTKKLKRGDIVLLSNIESRIIFAIVVVGEYDSGLVYREHHVLDSDTYSGNDSKYNKYDIKIDRFVEFCISYEDIATLLGKNLLDKTPTNIWKGSVCSFAKAFYRGNEKTTILERLRIYINSIMTIRSI